MEYDVNSVHSREHPKPRSHLRRPSVEYGSAEYIHLRLAEQTGLSVARAKEVLGYFEAVNSLGMTQH
jgi:hypothetical protein